MAGLKKGFNKIRALVGKPVKLSELEVKKFEEAFKDVKTLLDDALKSVLKMDRDEAYRYLKLLIDALQQVDVDFELKDEVESEVEHEPEVVEQRDLEERSRNFESFLSGLEPEMRAKAEDLLDCVKQFRDPEIGAAIVCVDCSLEKMIACIKAADPAELDEMDADLIKRRAGGQ